MLSFLKKKFVPFEPKIIHLKGPIKIVGLSIKTDSKNVFKQIPELGKQFNETKKEKGLPNRKTPWGFVSVCLDFNKEHGTWTNIIGDVVTSYKGKPSEFISFDIPAITYAVFSIRPKNRHFWSWTITQTKKYAYEKWLPNSPYERAGIIDDFEYHDARSFSVKNPEIELYIAIKKVDEEDK